MLRIMEPSLTIDTNNYFHGVREINMYTPFLHSRLLEIVCLIIQFAIYSIHNCALISGPIT